jgi:hypothetical protein
LFSQPSGVAEVVGSVVFLVDFFDFELGDSLVLLSVADSLVGDFSVVACVFFVLLFFSLVLVLGLFSLVLFEAGLVALSAAGLFVVAGDLVAGDGVIAGTGVGDGFVLTLALADGVMVAAADAAGVMVAPTLAVAAGVALAFVEAVVPVVVVPVVVPDVEVTPTLKLGVTP